MDLPHAWQVEPPDASSEADVARLKELLCAQQEDGRGWSTASADDVLVDVGDTGTRMRENVVVRDRAGVIRAWGTVHDRASGRMMFRHVVDRDLPAADADVCSDVLFAWAEAQAATVGAARGLAVQQIDLEAFADDERQHKWLENAGFNRVRSWWQMSRQVEAPETDLVPSPVSWEKEGVRFRLVRRAGNGMPDEDDLHAVHDVLEEAFTDHFNSNEETFEEFVFRLREDPGHRWDHWWLAELMDGSHPQPVGALVGTELGGDPAGSYVAYIGVRSLARGRGVAKGMLNTIIADAAGRGRNRVALEVDADSPTGAEGLYVSMGWVTKYVTESWHKDVPVAEEVQG
ncbi:GNAT family N-acetyltransferase [Nocardioides alcanivorans]|uniref:GNAT family N-acetyltransferase n=1 Tax=Nocardioides alcanivorans TaxID=2897352 RepID=UPI001F20322D|nr:GNAT family N-acetyltransferase [Nocardioides alcanivorans]